LFKDFANKGIMGFSIQRDNINFPQQRIGDGQQKNNQGNKDAKDFTPHHQIPPKK